MSENLATDFIQFVRQCKDQFPEFKKSDSFQDTASNIWSRLITMQVELNIARRKLLAHENLERERIRRNSDWLERGIE